VYHLEFGRVLRSLPHPGRAMQWAWSPDGTRLAIVGSDRNIHLWDIAARGEPAILRGHQAEVARVAFNHSGQPLASAPHDRTVRLWNAATGKLLVPTPGEGAPQFSPEDQRLAIASEWPSPAWSSGGRFSLWEVAGGPECYSLPALPGPRGADFSPDGRQMAV